jgi:hypothetical protein
MRTAAAGSRGPTSRRNVLFTDLAAGDTTVDTGGEFNCRSL